MASGSNSQVVDLQEVVEENSIDESIKAVVSSLKSAFMFTHFDNIERVIMSMKGKMELENQALKKERELIEAKATIERSEKMKAENELKDCKRECLQLKKEQEVFNELLRNSGENKRIIRELREEICELKCAKLKAETEVDAYKSRFQELNMKVFVIEKDLKSLMFKEAVNNVRVCKEVEGEKVVLNENANNVENGVIVKTEVVCIDSSDNIAVEADGGPRSSSPESRNGDLRYPVKVSGEGLGESAVKESGNGGERVVNVKAETGSVHSHENMVLEANGVSRNNLPKNGDGNIGASGGLTCQLQEIIEITDSDDDSSSGTSRRKILTKPGCEHGADVGVAGDNNEIKLLKRKHMSCSNSKDDGGGSNEPREKKSRVLDHDPKRAPFNFSAATTLSSGSNDRRNVSNPLGQASTILRQCEEILKIGQNSRTQKSQLVLDGFDGFSSEESSSSSDSDDFDFLTNFSATPKLAQANRNHYNWKCEADMVAALKQDVELCSRAVCVLFGQQAAVEKLLNSSSTSQNQGFDKDDADRGTALARFLNNGDSEGKLKKSFTGLVALDCRKLALKYSKQLFEMYQLKGEFLFSN